MKASSHCRTAIAAAIVVSMVGLAGCGRTDTRVNSDPGPGRSSQADGGEKTVQPDPNHASPTKSGTDPSTGTDSTGRPSGASGGTTAAGAGSGTSGTADGQTQQAAAPKE